MPLVVPIDVDDLRQYSNVMALVAVTGSGGSASEFRQNTLACDAAAVDLH